MKTKVGHYYVFFNLDDFWYKVNYWKSKGYHWIQERHMDYNPKINKNDLPVVLSVTKDGMGKTMMFGIVEYYKEQYFSYPIFVKIYNIELRKLKLKRLLKNEM
jgi:hypothetical protein